MAACGLYPVRDAVPPERHLWCWRDYIVTMHSGSRVFAGGLPWYHPDFPWPRGRGNGRGYRWCLPHDWYDALSGGDRRPCGAAGHRSPHYGRGAAEDAAALAFARLPPERRVALLAVSSD